MFLLHILITLRIKCYYYSLVSSEEIRAQLSRVSFIDVQLWRIIEGLFKGGRASNYEQLKYQHATKTAYTM